MKTKDLLAEVISLPVEERASIVDSVLKSLNPVRPEIDRKWAEVAKRRLNDLQSGKVEGVPGDKVLERVWNKFSE